MTLRTWATVAMFAIASLWSSVVEAQKLYAASVRTIADGGAGSVGGSLYTVALATGSAEFVAPIRLNGSSPLGITGLAVHPDSGMFYGITSPLSRSNPLSLVTIDPATGNATMIGSLRRVASDISFTRAGILFAWLPETSQLGVVNIETGGVTPIGPPGPPGPPAGLAIDSTGVAYITPKGAIGTLDTVEIATGLIKPGPPLVGAPFDSAVNSMTFTPSGLLLAVNSNAGAPAATRLVTINVGTGAVSNIGTLPDDTDGIAFANLPARESAAPTDWRSIALMTLGAIALVLGLIGWAVGRRPKTPL
ncbi:MAG TPA: hypothetical protein VM073_06905 [Usitatibacter sp.]|nr:hypothetical protein [Usitatibacter sp.]